MRSLAPLLVVLILATCGPSASGTPTASSSGAFDCSWTKPNAASTALGPIPKGAIPALSSYTANGEFEFRNASLGVLLPNDGRLKVDTTHSDGGAKLGWFRFVTGELTVTALRLDGPASFRADVASGYGSSGLQISGLRFSTPGCWEVRGRVGGGDPLTFVVRVDDPDRGVVTPMPSPIGGDCAVTKRPAVAVTPPPTAGTGPNPSLQFRSGLNDFLYGNDALIVLLPNDGILRASDPARGLQGGVKFAWWRIARGELAITTRRLDATTAPQAADVPSGYGDTGFQVSGLNFPEAGCWQVSGTVGAKTLTFVVNVAR
jgi:hypothetical protein